MKINRFSTILLAFGFTLGIYKGYIALWNDGETFPVRVFPYSASSLPDTDRSALAEGIRTEDPADLIHLIEDYLS